MTQSRFWRLRPYEFGWWRHGSKILPGSWRSAVMFFFPFCWFGKEGRGEERVIILLSSGFIKQRQKKPRSQPHNPVVVVLLSRAWEKNLLWELLLCWGLFELGNSWGKKKPQCCSYNKTNISALQQRVVLLLTSVPWLHFLLMFGAVIRQSGLLSRRIVFIIPAAGSLISSLEDENLQISNKYNQSQEPNETSHKHLQALPEGGQTPF